jgi:predicted enzyme related to lactoylglutathione lyase
MPERDGYIPGVPCWVDTSQPDPDKAAAFYRDLFGWEVENAWPPGSPGKYYIGRIRGGDVGAIGSRAEGEPPTPAWSTYVWVQSADEAAARVAQAGGRVLTDPFDVMDAGRMAVFADPEGAVFRVWQPNQHKGSQIVNEHGSVNFNVLNTRDLERAASFYGAVFGWRLLDLGPGAGSMWALPGYGDFLERSDPGLRERVRQLGGPEGFEDVVAGVNLIGDDQPPHWSVAFSVDNADAVAQKAAQLGGQVVVAPFAAPWVRMAVISDPQGATFTASQFVPENSNVGSEATTAA